MHTGQYRSNQGSLKYVNLVVAQEQYCGDELNGVAMTISPKIPRNDTGRCRVTYLNVALINAPMLSPVLSVSSSAASARSNTVGKIATKLTANTVTALRLV